MKEFLETLFTRARSPILGSCAFFFFVTNWKPIFFLFFSDESVQARIEFFDDNTSTISLLFAPSVLGLLFAAAAPWLSLLGAKFANWPHTQRRIMQIRADQRVAREKRNLEEEVAALERSQEAALVERAKTDEQIYSEISDPDIRRRLENEIMELRTKIDGSLRRSSAREDNLRSQVELYRQQAMIAKEQGRLDEAEYLLKQAQDITHTIEETSRHEKE